MSEDIVISIENIGKAYRIWESPSARLLSPLQAGLAGLLPTDSALACHQLRKAASRYRDFHALRNVSFSVKRGESVGIIGRNGSGKSTLLQIIAGTLLPTTGSVKVTGRIAALLELGSGFNPDFTGRENVYLNGAVLGLSRREVDDRFDQIASFADIGDFIEQPVKTYSSGMLMRLAFAVQTALDLEILIVDEALAVGDAPFQAKCFARMRALIEKGTSILLVSHDIGTIRNFCRRAICLSGGVTVATGVAKDVCDKYQLLCMREQGVLTEPADDNTGQPKSSAAFHAIHGPRNRDFERQASQKRAGNGRIRLVDCYLEDAAGRPTSLVEFNENVTICWLLKSDLEIKESINLGFTVKSLKGTEILSGTDKEVNHTLTLRAGQLALIRMPYRFPLKGDKYYFTTAIFCFPGDRKFVDGLINFTESDLCDLVEYCCFFSVNWNRRWAHYGPVQQDSSLEIVPINPTI